MDTIKSFSMLGESGEDDILKLFRTRGNKQPKFMKIFTLNQYECKRYFKCFRTVTHCNVDFKF